MHKISVIVPVYNVEKYLKQCLDSILAQKFKSFELICVNDGSTDNSRKILEYYKNQDIRIKIIDKQNGGLSSARNIGLNNADGDFIAFIDADDWISPDMLEKLYKNITEFNTDISMCAVNLFDNISLTIKQDSYFDLSIFPKSFENKIFSYVDTKEFTMQLPVMAWNKLYRRDFIEKCNAIFPEGKIFEDGAFFFALYFNTKKVSIVKEHLYFYRINRKGSILQVNNRQFIDIIDIVNLMFEYLYKSDIFDDVKYSFFKYKANDIIYRYQTIDKPFKKIFAQKFKKSSVLLQEKYFNFSLINKQEPIIYKCICDIKNNTSFFSYFYHKIEKRIMKKIIQILETDKNIYYLKFWNLIIKINKNINLCNIYYKNDNIYVKLFNFIKFKIKFEYSKLEK